MSPFTKSILAIISISIFVFLIFFTYITTNLSTNKQVDYEKISLGEKKLEDIIINNIGISNKIIYSSGSSVEVDNNENKTIITLNPGVYLIDLREIDKSIIIKSGSFEIENKGPGIFFVNNTHASKNIIFSFSSLLKLNLKNYKTGDYVTSADLYPNTYLILNPFKTRFVENADLLRLSQVFKLGYFNKNILSENNINNDLLNLISLNKQENKNIIKNGLDYILKQNILNNQKIDNFLSSNFAKIPGAKIINKYFFLMINPNKKSIYYKNIIIGELHSLLKSTKIDKNAIDEIKENINLLKKVDPKGAEEFNDIIKYLYSLSIDSENIYSLKNISSLINSDINLKNDSLIFLQKIYFLKNLKSNTNFYKDISEFRKQYFSDLNIDLEGNNKKSKSINDIEKIDYLLYFLENIILNSNLNSSNNNYLIEIFNDYVNIANGFYEYSLKETKRIGLFTNSKILDKFLKIIYNKYFEIKRSKDGLLLLKQNNKIIEKDIKNLEINIKKINDFYKNNVSILDPELNGNDNFLIKKYLRLEKKYKEYFMALLNYEQYSYSRNDLLTENAINENNSKISLSKEKLMNYLKQFDGININSINTKIMDYNYCQFPEEANENLIVETPYCYKVENLNISGINISFLLHPFNKNKIDEISVNNKNVSGSYKLDNIKIELEEKAKNSSENKDKYDFKKFLLSTFGPQKYDVKDNIFVKNDDVLKEDRVVQIFKKNKLFGDTGDFIGLKGFIDIAYNNLIVNKIGEKYLINIKKANFNIYLGRDNQYRGIFISKYNFSPKHSFINPEIKLMDKENKKELLSGNSIYINGEYNVLKIKDEIKKPLENYNILNSIIRDINYILHKTKVEIKYFKNGNYFILNTYFNDKELKIKVKGANLTSILYNNTEILSETSSYKGLENILKLIK